MEELIPGDRCSSLHYWFLECSSNIAANLLFECLPADVEAHVEERTLASATACGWGSRRLQGSREGLHSPSISLQPALQSTAAGGPSTRRPVGAAVQINVSGLPQSHAWAAGRSVFSKHLEVTFLWWKIFVRILVLVKNVKIFFFGGIRRSCD